MGNICCIEKQEGKAVLPNIIATQNLSSPHAASPPLLIEKTIRRGPENYQSIRYLGRGAFGSVVLAEEKTTRRQYAMKVIDKSKIKEFNVLQSGVMQKLSLGNPEMLVPIKETFQNKNYIYIIMQYVPKGDLYFYLRRNDVREQLNEGIVTGVLAEIVLGVEFLHNAGIIYRELKPENILVTNDGHVKLTDYGLSKILVESRGVKTFIGTFEYMAPETIGGEFGQKADIWALGVLMYELYFGTNPFEPLSTLGDSQRPHNPNLNSDKCFQMNYEKFDVEESLNEHIGHISQNFRDLLKGLLEKDPERRLNLQQIKNHPFFKNVDWVEVQERRNVGPLKQFVCNNNFILFRDAVGEEYKRRKYTKNALQGEHYEINLFEFRNSN